MKKDSSTPSTQKRIYTVSIGDDSFQVSGVNILEAKKNAQFNKRKLNLNGKTFVKFLKKIL